MSAPAIGQHAEAVYGRLWPLHRDTDAQRGYSLRVFIGGMGEIYEPIRSVVFRDGIRPSWEILFDPDLCPARFLPWLGQFFGVRVPVRPKQKLGR